MKTLKPILFLCVALCLASSCKKEVDMTLVQKTVFENADIRQINVYNDWEVNVVADNNTFVELEYSAYLEPGLNIQMDGTKLYIDFTGNVYPVINSVFRATVHTSQLEALVVDGASKVTVDGAFEGAQLDVKLRYASSCSGLSFTGEQCDIELNEASKLIGFHFEGLSCKATLDRASQFNGKILASDHLDIELHDASRFVNKGGITGQSNIVLKEGSRLNMVETQVNEMHVELNYASEATVWVTSLLEGTMGQASTIYYKGNPQINVDCSEASQLIPF